MTDPTPQVWVWTEPGPPITVVRVRDPHGTTYHRYTHWMDPAARLYAPWIDGATDLTDPAAPRWIPVERTAEDGLLTPVVPNEDGQLHGWRWARLLEHVETLTDVTEPGDEPRHWRTDGLTIPPVSYANAVAGFEAAIWKLAGLRHPSWTVNQVQQEVGVRSGQWVQERLDRLHAGADRLTGIVVHRLGGSVHNGSYEIRHWAAADRQARP